MGNSVRAPRHSVARRHDEILAVLKSEGSMSVIDLANRLGCSTATIRRDLQDLQGTSAIRRFHGAVAVETLATEGAFHERLSVADEEKHAIAAVVLNELQPGEVIGLNGGTTTTQIAHQIADMALDVTVVTNAVNIAFELTASKVPVVVVGGVLRPANYETTGPLALRALGHLHLDWAILGANGLDPRFGASTHTEAESSVGQAFSEQADRVVLACDHSKLAKTALFRMVEWDRVNAVACDPGGASTLTGWGLEPPADSANGGLWWVRHHG